MSAYLMLMHAPSRIIQEALIYLGAGINPLALPLEAWPIYSTREPDLPDDVLTVYDTQGKESGSLAITGEMIEFPGVQVRMRMRRYGMGYAKMVDVCRIMDELKRLELSISDADGDASYRVNELRRKGQPIPMAGTPASARRLITVNCIASITRVS